MKQLKTKFVVGLPGTKRVTGTARRLQGSSVPDGEQRACLEARRPHVVVVGRPAGAFQGQLNRMVGGQRCGRAVVFARRISMGEPGEARCLVVPSVAVTLHTRPSSVVSTLTCDEGMSSNRRAKAWLWGHTLSWPVCGQVIGCLQRDREMLAQGAMQTPVSHFATMGQFTACIAADSSIFLVSAPWDTRSSTTPTCPASHAQCRAVRFRPPCIRRAGSTHIIC